MVKFHFPIKISLIAACTNVTQIVLQYIIYNAIATCTDDFLYSHLNEHHEHSFSSQLYDDGVILPHETRHVSYQPIMCVTVIIVVSVINTGGFAMPRNMYTLFHSPTFSC